MHSHPHPALSRPRAWVLARCRATQTRKKTKKTAPALVGQARAATIFELGGAHPCPLPEGEGQIPRPSAAMARMDFKPHSGRAEKRRAWGGHGLRSKPMLRALTCCGCLSGVSAANKASSAAPPRARASQVARSEAEGHGQRGRLFFGYFLLARQKKVTAPPGAHPGQQLQQYSQSNS